MHFLISLPERNVLIVSAVILLVSSQHAVVGLQLRSFSRDPQFSYKDLSLDSLDCGPQHGLVERLARRMWIQSLESCLPATWSCWGGSSCYPGLTVRIPPTPSLVARRRQQPIESARCWPSTRRMSSSWKTMRSWPAMWVPHGFSWPCSSKALLPHPGGRGSPQNVSPSNPSLGHSLRLGPSTADPGKLGLLSPSPRRQRRGRAAGSRGPSPRLFSHRQTVSLANSAPLWVLVFFIVG